MTNDREYLELAAKAAGIELWHEDVFTNGLTQKVSDNGVLRWNPLTDDGDAFRLMVKCGFIVVTNGMNSRVGFPFVSSPAIEQHNGDPYAATRRAIVRAAAEIGRNMK